METFEVILTSEAVDNFLGCDHSNETSSAVLLCGTRQKLYLNILQNEI